MRINSRFFYSLIVASLLLCWQVLATAQAAADTSLPSPTKSVGNPMLIPAPPSVDAKGYVLMDANSGKIIAEKEASTRMPPASLTKLMTLYVTAEALSNDRISLTDRVPISEKAWRMGGSKMFVKEGDKVPAEDLIRGISTASGNDATVAMAEYIAGSEDAFVDIMNQQAQALGMTGTHFTDSTGMPHKDHYTTPHDIAILARAFITHYPQFYPKWFNEKWFTWSDIKQPNRNRLLWRDKSVDGIKTGHTDEAGFCLASSAKRDDMRLISIVMGAKDDNERFSDSASLLNYGYRFYKTYKLYSAGDSLSQPRVWSGTNKKVDLGLTHDLYITIPKGEYDKLDAALSINSPLHAPVVQGQSYGDLIVKLGDDEVVREPLIALKDDPKGGIWRRFSDSIVLSVYRLFNKV